MSDDAGGVSEDVGRWTCMLAVSFVVLYLSFNTGARARSDKSGTRLNCSILALVVFSLQDVVPYLGTVLYVHYVHSNSNGIFHRLSRGPNHFFTQPTDFISAEKRSLT
jgi:hypothetical protein